MGNGSVAAARGAADGALARLAERALTLLGVPLLLAAVGFGSGELLRIGQEMARRDGADAALLARVHVIEGRQREDFDRLTAAMGEAVRRGEAARAELARSLAERDREHDRQLAELAGQAASARELLGRVAERLEAVGRDVAEVKGVVMRTPGAPPPRAIDRLPPGGWGTPPR